MLLDEPGHAGNLRHGGIIDTAGLPPPARRAQKTAVVFNDTTVDNHHGCSLVMSAIKTLCQRHHIKIEASAPAQKNWQEQKLLVEAARRADILMVNGEGTIHHDNPAGKNLLNVGEFARQHNIPSALINLTWQDNGPDSQKLLANFDMISVRESASSDALNSIGMRHTIIPDLATLFSWHTAGLRRGIGFTDNVVPESARKLEILRCRYDGKPINLLHNIRGIPLTLRMMRRYLTNTSIASISDWGSAARAVSGLLKSQVRTVDELVAQIGQLELLVAGRFHALALALSTTTPVIGVASNTHKIEATILDAGLQSWRNARLDAIDQNLLEKAASWHTGEEQAVAQYLSQGRAAMDQLFSNLRTLAK